MTVPWSAFWIVAVALTLSACTDDMSDPKHPAGDQNPTWDSGLASTTHEPECGSLISAWPLESEDAIIGITQASTHPILEIISGEGNVTTWADDACPMISTADDQVTVTGGCTSSHGATYEGTLVWDYSGDTTQSTFAPFSIDYTDAEGHLYFLAQGSYAITATTDGVEYVWDLGYTLEGDDGVGVSSGFTAGTFLYSGSAQCQDSTGECTLAGYVFVVDSESGHAGDFCVQESWTSREGTCAYPHVAEFMAQDNISVSFSDDCSRCFDYSIGTDVGTYCP